jgi:hypothetical protein
MERWILKASKLSHDEAAFQCFFFSLMTTNYHVVASTRQVRFACFPIFVESKKDYKIHEGKYMPKNQKDQWLQYAYRRQGFPRENLYSTLLNHFIASDEKLLAPSAELNPPSIFFYQVFIPSKKEKTSAHWSLWKSLPKLAKSIAKSQHLQVGSLCWFAGAVRLGRSMEL